MLYSQKLVFHLRGSGCQKPSSSLSLLTSNIPPSEKPFLILVVGYPAEEAQVPMIEKKLLVEIATFI